MGAWEGGMHPEFLGQGSITLSEKWEAIRGSLPFCRVSALRHGLQRLSFPSEMVMYILW